MKRIWGWLMELWPLWVALIVAVAITLLMLLWWTLTLEQQIRIAGLFLQLLGINVVAYSIRAFFHQWVERYPGFRGRVITEVVSDTIGMIDSGRVSATRPVDSNATIELRVEALKRNLEFVRQQVDDIPAIPALMHRHLSLIDQ